MVEEWRRGRRRGRGQDRAEAERARIVISVHQPGVPGVVGAEVGSRTRENYFFWNFEL